MKKIAIVTLKNVFNYGNSLQNYAVQKILQNIGYCADTIINNEETNELILKAYFKSIFSINDVKSKKEVSFIKFERKYIRQVSYNQVKKVKSLKKYDCFLVGSDQVWNPTWYNDELKKLYLLDFCENNKKISYAASFGVETIPEKWREWFSSRLGYFKYISVREEAGAKIIKNLINKEATVLIDPTLQLTKHEWRTIESKPPKAQNRYVLTYFLSSKCCSANELLSQLRKDNVVYELLNIQDEVCNTVGPSEFLWLFDHADLILTDSFHACVFSFLFDKPFVVYDRNWDGGNMNSRLETLLSKFHLERKYAGSGLENDIWEHDYKEGYKQLEIERKKAMNFLKEALEQ